MRSGALFLVGAIAGSLLATSCAIVGYDLDGYGPAKSSASGGGQGGSGGGSSSTGAGAGCGDGKTCSETPPMGWRGPVALLENQKGTNCSGDFPNLVFIGGGSPRGAPATCSGCTCDTTPCGANTIVTTYTDAGCTTGPLAYALGETCGSVSPTGAAHVVVTPPATTGTCTASAVTVHADPAAFGTQVIACGGVKLGKSCGASERCAPAPTHPFEPGLCIFQTGNVQCPAGLTKHVFFDSFDDTRDCTPCTCGAPAAKCAVSVKFSSDAACATPVGTAMSGGGCTALTGAWNGGIATLTSPCMPIDGQPMGDVSGSDPTTFCCE